MRPRSIFASVNMLLTGIALLVTGILLVVTVVLTVFELPWIAFLSGVLCAGVIGLIGRLSYAETELADVRANVRYIDDEMPLMVLYVDADGYVRFHNQAYRMWLRARREAINGRLLRDVVGLTLYGRIRPGIDAALAGEVRHETREFEGLGGPYSRLYIQYLPNMGRDGKVEGAFLVQTDISQIAGTGDPREAALGPPTEPMPSHLRAPAPAPATREAPAAPDAEPERHIFVSTMAEELTDWKDAGERLRAALDNDEFCLYFQAIRPLGPSPETGPFYEVLLRLREEEEGLMPPGAFLPLAEEYGLMMELDKWVVKHVLDWVGASPERQGVRFALNLSAATLSHPEFADFVVAELARRGAKGAVLTFEIAERDARSRVAQAARLVAALHEAGCRTTLCGFGQDAGSFALLKPLAVDYLKIDGDIVLGMARDPTYVTKLKAIARVAHATNRRTIAEFVESEQAIERLREHGIDYAQGFGIARPQPLSDLA